MANLIVPLDRAHPVLLGTGIEPLEQVPRQISAGITRIGYQLHLSDFLQLFLRTVVTVFERKFEEHEFHAISVPCNSKASDFIRWHSMKEGILFNKKRY
jgi:hypothetical protein